MRLARTMIGLALAAFAASALCGRGFAQPAPFYKGKQITLLIASGAGGGYDTYARALARHMARHIPGNPNIVPKNVPGAGGLIAATTLSNTPPPTPLPTPPFTTAPPTTPPFTPK